MSWEKQIAGCFGSQDANFAIHWADEGRAFELLAKLRKERVGWSVVGPAFRKYLKDDGCSAKKISSEMARVRAHLKPWLDD